MKHGPKSTFLLEIVIVFINLTFFSLVLTAPLL